MTRAITRPFKRRSVWGDVVSTVRDVDVTSYTTGGETITAADLGLREIHTLQAISTEFVNHEVTWLPATNRFKITTTVTGVELGAAVDGGTFRVLATGK